MEIPEKRSNLIGDYMLTGKRLGNGSYSVVREAVSLRNNRVVALKIINLEADQYISKYYKREPYILSQLSHEHIIKMIEVIESPKRFILVFELIPEDLCDFVRTQRRGKVDEALARILFRQIIAAVKYIHGKGIIHRDIKLENLLIDPTKNKIKLADFGLSNNWDQVHRLSTICGSPEYSSPELHEGKPYGNEIDVWALGVVLFAMVVGRLPFDVPNKKSVSSRQRRELFLEETKRGIRTVKHQGYLSSASHSFKDLASKLLNPDQLHRIQIAEVEIHDWVVFGKVDISKFQNYNQRQSFYGPPPLCNKPLKPSTAHIGEAIPRKAPRPATKFDRHENLRATLKSRMQKTK